ncbi:MAG: hypothetical protein K1W41_07430 [Lachnospiraceae bacterium]
MSDINQNFELITHGKVDNFINAWIIKHKYSHVKIAVLDSEKNENFFSIAVNTPIVDDRGIAHIVEHCILGGTNYMQGREAYNIFFHGDNELSANAVVYPEFTQYSLYAHNYQNFKSNIKLFLDTIFSPIFLHKKEIYLYEGCHIKMNENGFEYGGVVYNEASSKMSDYKNQIIHLIRKKVWSDNYVFQTAGIPDDIIKTSYKDIVEYYKKFYVVQNMSFVLATSKNNVEKCFQLISEYLLPENENIKKEHDTIRDKINYQVNNFYVRYDKKKEIYFCKNCRIDTRDYFSIFKLLIIKGILSRLLKTKYENDKDLSFEMWFSPFDMFPVLSIVCALKEENATLLVNKLDALEESFADNAMKIINYVYKEISAEYRKIVTNHNWQFIVRMLFMYWRRSGIFDFRGLEFESILYNELIKLKQLWSQRDKRISFWHNMKETFFFSVPFKKRDIVCNPELLWESDNDIDQKIQSEKFNYNKNDLENIYKKLRMLFDFDRIYDNLIYFKINSSEKIIIRINFCLKKILIEKSFFVGIITELLNSYFRIYKQNSYIDVTYESYSNYNEVKRYVCIKICSKRSEIIDKIEIVKNVIKELYHINETHLYDIVYNQYNYIKRDLIEKPHKYAVYHALSGCSLSAQIYEKIHGINYGFSLRKLLDEDFEKGEVVFELRSMLREIFCINNLIMTYSAQQKEILFAQGLYERIKESVEDNTKFNKEIKDSFLGMRISKGIYYNQSLYNAAMAFNIENGRGVKYDGKIKIIKKYVNELYFPLKLRKNGVYSYACNFIPTSGNFYMVSYCDPNVSETIDIFKGFSVYFQNNINDNTFNKLKLRALRSENVELNYIEDEERKICFWFSNMTMEMKKAELEEIAYASMENMEGCINSIMEAMENACICVIGNRDKLNQPSSGLREIISLDLLL